MAKKRKQPVKEPVEEEEEDGNSTASSGESSDNVDATEVAKMLVNNDEDLASEESENDDDGSPSQPTPPPATAMVHPSIKSDGRYHNKQRLLVLSSRGVTARYRHLLEDLRTLIPHSKKESKLDVGKFHRTILYYVLDIQSRFINSYAHVIVLYCAHII